MPGRAGGLAPGGRTATHTESNSPPDSPTDTYLALNLIADGLDSVPSNRSFGEGRFGVDSANSLEGLIEWNSMAPSSSREQPQSGANAAFSPGEPLGRVDSSGCWRPVSRAGVALPPKFSAPLVP